MFLAMCVLILSVTSVSSISFSRFEKTNVIDYICDSSWSLESGQARTIFQCGLRCNGDMDCRRFLFCKTSSKCKLYGDGTDCTVVGGDAEGCRCYKKVIGCDDDECTCPWGFYGDNCQYIVTDCYDAILKGLQSEDQILIRIKPEMAPEAFDVFCQFKSPSYLTILHRFKKCMKENFNRTFQEYEQGFGIDQKNRWLGLKKILYILNGQHTYQLQIRFFRGQSDYCFLIYDNFTIGDATTGYQFQTTGINYENSLQPCGDSMIGSNNTLDLRGRPFSTYDKDETSSHCAARFGGGWWFADDPNCTNSFLTATKKVGNLWTDKFWHTNMIHITMKLLPVLN